MILWLLFLFLTVAYATNHTISDTYGAYVSGSDWKMCRGDSVYPTSDLCQFREGCECYIKDGCWYGCMWSGYYTVGIVLGVLFLISIVVVPIVCCVCLGVACFKATRGPPVGVAPPLPLPIVAPPPMVIAQPH